MLNIPENTVFYTKDILSERPNVPACFLEYPDFRVRGVRVTAPMTAREDREGLVQVLYGTVCAAAASREARLGADECFAIDAGTAYSLRPEGEAGLLIYEIHSEGDGDKFLTDGKKPENAKKRMADHPMYTPFRVKDMAAFAAGQVVISSLYVTPMAKYNIMGYDLGQKIGPHSRPFTGWLTMLQGEIQFTVGNQSWRLHPGDSLLMPPDIVHGATALTENAVYQLLVLKKL